MSNWLVVKIIKLSSPSNKKVKRFEKQISSSKNGDNWFKEEKEEQVHVLSIHRVDEAECSNLYAKEGGLLGRRIREDNQKCSCWRENEDCCSQALGNLTNYENERW